MGTVRVSHKACLPCVKNAYLVAPMPPFVLLGSMCSSSPWLDTAFVFLFPYPFLKVGEADNPDTEEQSQILQNTNGLFAPNENFKEALYMQKRPGANINVPITRKTKLTNQVLEKEYHCIPQYSLNLCALVEVFMRHLARL